MEIGKPQERGKEGDISAAPDRLIQFMPTELSVLFPVFSVKMELAADLIAW